MSVSASIPDTSLGLTSSEIQILRQQQQLALQGGHTGGGVTRGRGTGRTSNSSSRAASAASSHGRLLLDPMSLRALSHQLNSLQEQIRNRLDYLEEQMQLSLQNSTDRAGNVVRNADAEIARTRSILTSIDDLETEFAKIANIREIVKQYRARIEGLDQRLDQVARRRR
jgi:small-conductance mechanosensitive channel